MDSFVQIDRRAGMRRRTFIASSIVFAAYLAAVSAAQTPANPPTGSQPTTAPSIEKRDVPVSPPATIDKPSPTAPKTSDSTAGDIGWLRVTGNNVNVRSRPDVNSIAVTRVSQDMLLQATGKEFGWYAIKPPPDVFSLIAGRYHDDAQNRDVTIVEREGNNGTIKVEENSTLRVRAGSATSTVDPEHSDVQTKLKSGDHVRIVGQDGDWLRIVPPDGVKVYIKDEFVQRISDAEATSAGGVAGAKLAPSGASPASPVRPAAGWAAQLKDVETKIETESRKPALEQGWQPLLTELKPVADQRDEPLIAGSAARLIDSVQERIRGQDSLRAGSGLVKKDGTELASAVEKTAEPSVPANTTTTQPAAATPPTTLITPVVIPEPRQGFDVEGELQATFAVPAGKDGLRYRLIDPATRVTRAYVEFPWELNFKATEHIGRYVGIQGERTVDMQKEVNIWRASKATVLTPDRPVARPRP